jgi:hypothetical protein
MFASLMGVPAHSSGKSHKHGSSHSSRRTTTTTSGHHKSSKTKSHSSVALETPSSSFLFVINELQVDYDPLPGESQRLTDQWLNHAPPQRADAYIGEMVGTVFRYQNGVINLAPGYMWYEFISTGLRGDESKANVHWM